MKCAVMTIGVRAAELLAQGGACYPPAYTSHSLASGTSYVLGFSLSAQPSSLWRSSCRKRHGGARAHRELLARLLVGLARRRGPGRLARLALAARQIEQRLAFTRLARERDGGDGAGGRRGAVALLLGRRATRDARACALLVALLRCCAAAAAAAVPDDPCS
eukprot:scaffold11391_cov70-Phaeocystis_antarctica.AAC.5